ncbi:uncharacterized protein LOC126801972 isoform X2 [Argentina anserina]|uniref:uncharacterized protein LOC126801972 isoform X2 n=1 Tax=Argentina anserina TaxID=57926 RepID=UPI0021766EA8|nr:uncharacterized protein LOC126801972 isoform X2 [Potentilla anserina]
MEALIGKVNAEGAGLLQGSGWVWLALDKETKKLVVEPQKISYNFDNLASFSQLLFPSCESEYKILCAQTPESKNFMGFSFLNGVFMVLLNLILELNSVGFYQEVSFLYLQFLQHALLK